MLSATSSAMNSGMTADAAGEVEAAQHRIIESDWPARHEQTKKRQYHDHRNPGQHIGKRLSGCGLARARPAAQDNGANDSGDQSGKSQPGAVAKNRVRHVEAAV